MDKTHITHVNDGFVFLGHRIIRKRGSNGRMSVVTTIPKEKAKAFVHKLTEALSGNHDIGTVDMIGSLNRQLAGWAAFYKFTDFTGRTFRRIDHVVFWKMAHWLAQIPITYQTSDAELVSLARNRQGENLVCLWPQ